MADIHVRSDSVDVEQIMEQIRSRIREKRGVDYTEDQIRELASVRLEKFLDPKNLRSDLIEQFRRSRPSVNEHAASPYQFEDHTLYETHRGALRFIRRLLNPILKLFFNPNAIVIALHKQAAFNEEQQRLRADWNVLYYEVLHNLVLETTRAGIEVKNLRMRVEALASRLDFSERRVRALEGVVQYRPDVSRHRDRRHDRPEPAERPVPPGDAPAALETAGVPVEGAEPQDGGTPGQGGAAGEGRRRRRRRRGRRGTGAPGAGGPLDDASAADAEGPEGDDQPDEAAEAAASDATQRDPRLPDPDQP
jgi:hypothetical protein